MPADNGSPPSLRDVARRAGVALSSASRALAEGTSASPELRAKVRAAARELGYEPNLLAQSLSRGATGLIGFMVREIESPAMPPVLHGAEEALRAAGYALVFSTAEGRADLAADYIRLLRGRRVDGFVLALSDADHPAVRRELERVQVPCVLLDRELDWLDASCVLFDHETTAQEAAEHLLGLGHRRFAFIAGTPTMRTTPTVEAGLRAALNAVPEAELVVDARDFTDEHGRESVHRLLAGAAPPTALIAGNGQIGHGVIHALREHGRQPGRDIALVCCDDPPALGLLDPAVAAVRWDFHRAGGQLAAMLLRRLEGGPPERVVMPTTFLPRGSCVPPVEAAQPR